MALDGEAVTSRCGLLPRLELVVAELEDRAARGADHVVVVLVTENVLESAAAVAGVEAFVRDRGAGFELAAVPEDAAAWGLATSTRN